MSNRCKRDGLRKLGRLYLAAISALVLAAGLSVLGATSASAQSRPAPQPKASPSNPLPREDVRLSGQIIGSARPVVLQKKTTKGWRTISKSKTSSGGYHFTVRTKAAAATYRIVAPRRRGLAGVITKTRRVHRVEAGRYWDLDDKCRGTSDQNTMRHCAARDRMLKRLGKVVARDFHEAWRKGNRERMQALAAPSAYLHLWGDRRATSRAGECEYRKEEPFWYCFVEMNDGYWMGYRTAVTKHLRPRFPVWKVTSAAPDV